MLHFCVALRCRCATTPTHPPPSIVYCVWCDESTHNFGRRGVEGKKTKEEENELQGRNQGGASSLPLTVC